MIDHELKIGVLLCDCGQSISKVVDFVKLKEFTSELETVSVVKRHSFLCGEDGKQEIDTLIREGANRIVIAACTPKLYEPLFKRCLKESGLNPFFLEIANIREQCAWPHFNDRKGVNKKAQRLIRAAVGKVRNLSAIEDKRFEVTQEALVIGAGVAGLQAAMDIADFGFKVHLIEKAPTIGGNALKLGLAFPTDDGAFCISSPDFLPGIRKCFYRSGLLQHPNITLHTLSEIRELQGALGNFEVKISHLPRGVHENLCINCGMCVDVCPVEIKNEINYGLNNRKAIYLPHPNAVPPVYVIDWENCTKCGECVKICPTQAVHLDDVDTETSLRVGAIVLATGFQEFESSVIKPYKYGVDKDVITQLQLARILDPFGPTRGELITPSNGKTPNSIVMIQCVGSRDVNTNPYCSKICCTFALKHAIHLKEKYAPDAELYVCYMDIRTTGKDYEELYTKARRLGVRFVRGKPSEIYRDPKSGNLMVGVEDTLLNRPIEIEADLVVLSAGLVPPSSSDETAEILGIEVDDNGFAKEVYSKLKPIETKVKGIYLCGGIQGPKDIPESVTQAEAAAFRVVHDLENFVVKDMDVAYVKEDVCDGCEICVEVCPYDAIAMVESKGEENQPRLVARIDELRCDRCGSCSSRCPTGAVQLRRYEDNQVLSQLRELLRQNSTPFSPQIVAFCCDECGYATVDLAGMGKISYPTNVLPVRVSCLGWVSLYQLFKAFEYGADGILLVGCLMEKCQHLKGVNYAEKIVTFANDILNEIGFGTNRIRLVPVCAADPTTFSTEAESLFDGLRSLQKNRRGVSPHD